eukprot:1467664-Amphidinium_carterae.1
MGGMGAHAMKWRGRVNCRVHKHACRSRFSSCLPLPLSILLKPKTQTDFDGSYRFVHFKSRRRRM